MAEWYYLENREQKGPITEEQLRTLVSQGHLGPEHLLWSEGMADWQAARTVPGLEFRSAPPRAAVFNRAQTGASAEAELGPVRNWMPWAIVATIFCCQLGGIISIIYASKANSAGAAGDLAGAHAAAGKARLWFILSLLLGPVLTAIAMAMGLFQAFLEMQGGNLSP